MAGDPDLPPADRARPWRVGALLLAVVSSPLAAGLTLAWLSCGLSWWSGALSAGLLSLSLGLVRFARRASAARALLVAGLVLVVGPWCGRAVLARGTESVRVITLPGPRGARTLATLYPERDGSLAAAGWIGWVGGLQDEEAPQFRRILADAYARGAPGTDLLPTPAIATYLGLQRPTDFDTIVISPDDGPSARAGVIFLHGFGGNFLLYCREIAEAAKTARLTTLCPSVDASGAWWTARGDATLKSTIDYARSLGLERLYLAGLSNGAAGASVLALAHERELSGLILISGMREKDAPHLPVLVVQGATDRMMPASHARDYASRASNVRYHEIAGGHLVILSRSDEVRPVIADFLRGQEDTSGAE